MVVRRSLLPWLQVWESSRNTDMLKQESLPRGEKGYHGYVACHCTADWHKLVWSAEILLIVIFKGIDSILFLKNGLTKICRKTMKIISEEIIMRYEQL
jgi:hypothetical protein